MRSSSLLKTKERSGTPDWSCQGGEAAIFGEKQECHSLCISYKAGQAWLSRGCVQGLCSPWFKRHAPSESPSRCPEASDSNSSTVFASQGPLDWKDFRAPKKTNSDTMRKHLGGRWLAIVCVLVFSQLAAVKARGIKHRFKWNRKAPPTTSQVTEAPKAEKQMSPGTFIKHGRKLDIDFGAEGNRYYEANYWQFPDEIHYNGCSDANVTKENFVTGCINATQAANEKELSQEKQDDALYQQILWRLVRELCNVKHCDFWLEKGAGLRVTTDQSVMFCLLVFIWFIVK